MSTPFELLLFATNPSVIRAADHAGMHGFIVDMENRGKQSRQSGFDTQINQNTIEDLATVRKNTNKIVICRINGYGDHTEGEIEQVIATGADEILLPMVRTPEEVMRVLDLVNGRSKLGILVETMDAVNCAEKLGALPLSRVYVGLNDLCIDRKLHNIFVSVMDGTLDSIRPYFAQKFGFGGLTLPDKGSPIPCRLLTTELNRLGCDFTFLRRSFYRDIEGKDMQEAVPAILDSVMKNRIQPKSQAEEDHNQFVKLVQNLENANYAK
jgi:hypothetical protein